MNATDYLEKDTSYLVDHSPHWLWNVIPALLLKKLK